MKGQQAGHVVQPLEGLLTCRDVGKANPEGRHGGGEGGIFSGENTKLSPPTLDWEGLLNAPEEEPSLGLLPVRVGQGAG